MQVSYGIPFPAGHERLASRLAARGTGGRSA
jgi:hypothetical protein